MASSGKGLLGSYRGRLSNLVVYELLGKTVVRTLPSVKPPKATGAKKQAQEEFSNVMKVLQATLPFVRLGFGDAATGRLPFQEAMSVNLKRYRAAAGTNDLQWLLPALGTRAGATHASWRMHQGKALVEWGGPQAGKPWNNSDIAMLMVVSNTSLVSWFAQSTREERQAEVSLPGKAAQEEVTVFLAFLNAFRSRKQLTNVSEAQIADEENA